MRDQDGHDGGHGTHWRRLDRPLCWLNGFDDKAGTSMQKSGTERSTLQSDAGYKTCVTGFCFRLR